MNKRYSDDDRPLVGERCFFSYCVELIPGEFVVKAKVFIREWIENGKMCEVVRNAASFVEVRFEGASETDYVSPMFLLKRELTAFGRAFFEQNAEKMEPRIRKYFE